MRYRVFTFAAAALLLVGACMPRGAAAQNAGLSDNLPVVTANLSLSDALRLADADNVAIMQAQAGSAAAAASAAGAKAALQPSASAMADIVNGNATRILGSSPGVMPASVFSVPSSPFVEQNRIKIMAPLFTGGLLRKGAEAAEGQANAARSGTDARRLSTQEEVAEAYANVLLNQALLASQQSRLAYEQEQVRITRQKVDTGALAPVDLLREQAERDDAESAIAQAQADIQIALVDLKAALGVGQTSNVTLSDTLDSLGIANANELPISLSAAIQDAYKSRPELVAAEQRVVAARARVRAAQAEYAPQIYAVGVAATNAQVNAIGLTGYTVGLTASISLYDGGDRKADIDRAKALLESAQAGDRAAQQTVEVDVAKAYYTLQSAVRQVVSAKSGTIAAQKDYDLATLRYNAGKSTTADRLDALDALTRAQTELAKAQTARFDAQAAQTIALGIALE